MSRSVYITAAVLLSAASLGLLWLSDTPLGVPGEWTWERIGHSDTGPLPVALIGPAIALGAAVLYAALCWAIGRRIGTSRGAAIAGWLVLLAIAGGGLLLALGSAPPAGHDLARLPVVLYDPGASGYFTIARYGADGEPLDAEDFLAGYERRMRGGDVLHIGTHPPGLILAQRGLVEICRSSPPLTQAIRAVTPASVDEAFDVLDRRARIGPPLENSDRAALWLGVLVMHTLAAATVVPLYLLVRRYRTRVESWRAVCLWPLVPAIAVFLPKSDALFPFLGTLFLWLWLEGCARGSVVRSVAAGVMMWVGMSLSLAMLPVAALGAFLALWEWRTLPPIGSRPVGLRKLAVAVVCAAFGFLASVVALWAIYDVNLMNVWLWNYRNHAGFYEEYPRTWWKWLLVNPLEFALAAGAPLAIAAVVGAWSSVRSAGHGPDGKAAGSSWSSARLPPLGPVVGCALVWSIVWLWGKNMGEAARLWLVFQPWLVWLAAGTFGSDRSGPRASDSGNARWLWTLGLQAVVCAATVLRVSGFHYLDAAPP